MDKIVCVGKNYIKHAQELGDPIPTEPLFFIKPPSTICKVPPGPDSLTELCTKVQIPNYGEVHHEVELVFQLKVVGSKVTLSHFTIGVDMTIRTLQARLKKLGQPWEKAKVFRNSSILGNWRPVGSMEAVLKQPFALSVNGQIRQEGVGKDMRWNPQVLIEEAERWFPLCDGDILFTGTPEGVGRLKPGDQVRVYSGDLDYNFICE